MDIAFKQRQLWPSFNKENAIFSKLKSAYYTTTLINSEGYKRGLSPTEYWVRNVYGKQDDLLWSVRDPYSSVNGYKGALYQNNTYPTGNDGKSMRTTVCYQYGLSRPNRNRVNQILKNAFKQNGATKVNILKTAIWRYFPRFSPVDSQRGILWDILDIQGKYGIWYAGSSVIFESVKSVVEYNKLLVRSMQPIKKTNCDEEDSVNSVANDDDDDDDKEEDDDEDKDHNGIDNDSNEDNDGNITGIENSPKDSDYSNHVSAAAEDSDENDNAYGDGNENHDGDYTEGDDNGERTA